MALVTFYTHSLLFNRLFIFNSKSLLQKQRRPHNAASIKQQLTIKSSIFRCAESAYLQLPSLKFSLKYANFTQKKER